VLFDFVEAKKRWTMKYILSICVLMLIFISGCSKGKNEDIYKVGSILSLSGSAANYGLMEKKGYDLAVEEINAKGGINGKKLNVIYEDSELKPAIGVSSLKKLVEFDKVPVIVGCTGSSVCLAVAPVADENKVVVISAGASTPKLTKMGGAYFFRVMPSDSFAGIFLANWVVEEGYQHPAILYINNEWGDGLREATERAFKKHQIQIVGIEACKEGEMDFRTPLTSLKSKNPDVVFFFMHPEEGAEALKQAHNDIKLEGAFFGADAFSDEQAAKIAGESIEELRFCIPAAGSGPFYEAFKTNFQKKYGEIPSAVSMNAYDAMRVVAYAIEKAGYNGPALQRALSDLRNFESAAGIITFDEYGDIISRKYTKMVYENGKAVPYIKIDNKLGKK
jgi:branched-chain amino acid transport system substrate-binding protein